MFLSSSSFLCLPLSFFFLRPFFHLGHPPYSPLPFSTLYFVIFPLRSFPTLSPITLFPLFFVLPLYTVCSFFQPLSIQFFFLYEVLHHSLNFNPLKVSLFSVFSFFPWSSLAPSHRSLSFLLSPSHPSSNFAICFFENISLLE